MKPRCKWTELGESVMCARALTALEQTENAYATVQLHWRSCDNETKHGECEKSTETERIRKMRPKQGPNKQSAQATTTKKNDER